MSKLLIDNTTTPYGLIVIQDEPGTAYNVGDKTYTLTSENSSITIGLESDDDLKAIWKQLQPTTKYRLYFLDPLEPEWDFDWTELTNTAKNPESWALTSDNTDLTVTKITSGSSYNDWKTIGPEGTPTNAVGKAAVGLHAIKPNNDTSGISPGYASSLKFDFKIPKLYRKIRIEGDVQGFISKIATSGSSQYRAKVQILINGQLESELFVDSDWRKDNNIPLDTNTSVEYQKSFTDFNQLHTDFAHIDQVVDVSNILDPDGAMRSLSIELKAYFYQGSATSASSQTEYIFVLGDGIKITDATNASFIEPEGFNFSAIDTLLSGTSQWTGSAISGKTTSLSKVTSPASVMESTDEFLGVIDGSVSTTFKIPSSIKKIRVEGMIFGSTKGSGSSSVANLYASYTFHDHGIASSPGAYTTTKHDVVISSLGVNNLYTSDDLTQPYPYQIGDGISGDIAERIGYFDTIIDTLGFPLEVSDGVITGYREISLMIESKHSGSTEAIAAVGALKISNADDAITKSTVTYQTAVLKDNSTDFQINVADSTFQEKKARDGFLSRLLNITKDKVIIPPTGLMVGALLVPYVERGPVPYIGSQAHSYDSYGMDAMGCNNKFSGSVGYVLPIKITGTTGKYRFKCKVAVGTSQFNECEASTQIKVHLQTGNASTSTKLYSMPEYLTASAAKVKDSSTALSMGQIDAEVNLNVVSMTYYLYVEVKTSKTDGSGYTDASDHVVMISDVEMTKITK